MVNKSDRSSHLEDQYHRWKWSIDSPYAQDDVHLGTRDECHALLGAPLDGTGVHSSSSPNTRYSSWLPDDSRHR
ncbi:MAG: hypothetical protein ACYCQJ_13620 [Nitrososphaerales archaeon]